MACKFIVIFCSAEKRWPNKGKRLFSKNAQCLLNLNVLNVTSIILIAKPITKPANKSELIPNTIYDALT